MVRSRLPASLANAGIAAATILALLLALLALALAAGGTLLAFATAGEMH